MTATASDRETLLVPRLSPLIRGAGNDGDTGDGSVRAPAAINVPRNTEALSTGCHT